jgi:hypothetical protein
VSVEFTALGQEITFAVDFSLSSGYTMSIWNNADSVGFGSTTYGRPLFTLMDSDENGALVGWEESSSSLTFNVHKGVDIGRWRFSGTPYASWGNITIKFNPSSSSNDPVVYINGTGVSVTDVLASSDALTVTAIKQVLISNDDTNAGIDGKVIDARIYNRLLSTGEIYTLSRSENRGKYVVPNGMVFWSPLTYREGSSGLEGVTLASSDTFPDLVSGAQGVPSGSPVGRGTTDPIIAAGVDSLSFGEGSFQRLWFDDNGIHGTSPVTT